jgi:hypothetical protein
MCNSALGLRCFSRKCDCALTAFFDGKRCGFDFCYFIFNFNFFFIHLFRLVANMGFNRICSSDKMCNSQIGLRCFNRKCVCHSNSYFDGIKCGLISYYYFIFFIIYLMILHLLCISRCKICRPPKL